MVTRRITTADDFRRYDAWVTSHPHGTLWQSLEWKRYQESLGRETRIYVEERGGAIEASALVVIDRTVGGWSTWDVPRGPLSYTVSGISYLVSLLESIVSDAKKDRCLSIYLSPLEEIRNTKYEIRNTHRNEQPSATRQIDLTKSEDETLKQMKSKGRYNIRIAKKRGVRIEESTDVGTFYALLGETARRDGFKTLPTTHYAHFLTDLEGSFLLVARNEKRAVSNEQRPIAALLGVVWSKVGYYYYGASSHVHRASMAPYLLQWEAMRRCKEKGCTTYDLLGIVPPHSKYEIRNTKYDPHPWAGVSAFKEKFGGTVVTYPEEKQIVLRPMVKKLLDVKRKVLG